MKSTKELIGCKVIIRDADNNQLVADTKIVDVDSYTSIIRVSASGVRCFGERDVTALVFGKDGVLYEYSGKQKSAVVVNEVQFSLGMGKNKEDRKKARYKMEAKGIIQAVMLEEQLVFLRKPIEMCTKNISANGLLLETMAGSFEIGDKILLEFKLGDYVLKNLYKIVRIQNSSLRTEEYGCLLLNAEKTV